MVKEFSFNDGEVIRGMVMQGERHTYREPSFPEENKCLFTIPIRRKIVGKAVAILMGLGILKDVGHPIKVVQFDQDRFGDLGNDILVAEAVNNGIDPDAIKELAAVLEMAVNGSWIHDGDYFAFYWCPGWVSVDDEEEEEAEDQELVEGQELDLAELGQQRAAELEGYEDR